MKLISLNDALSMGVEQSNALFHEHINPGLLKAFKILGFGDMDIESAEGAEIRLRDGRRVLDFSSAIGVLGLGHNHPRIVAAERRCHEGKIVDALKVAPIPLQGVLAHNLCQFLPRPLRKVFFSVSGAEAVEAAMKICEKAQGPKKTKFITTAGSFHGKTHGALSVTMSGGFQDGFVMGLPEDAVVEVPYGDLSALAKEIENATGGGGSNPFIAVILEAIQGQGIVEAPEGYLRGVANLCQKNDILVIFDEVKVGMGRAGTFCAFEREDVVPDVVTLSKALGGGKRAIGAMITTDAVFDKAYGKRKDSALHTTTFGGLGESCAVAIETLRVFEEEHILASVREKGEHLHEGLRRLAEKYPEKISGLRGRGLVQGVQFRFQRSAVDRVVDTSKFRFFNTLDAVMTASIIRRLYRRHNIITHFSPSDPDVLHIMPPLIVEKAQIDQFIDAVDEILSVSWNMLLAGFVKENLADLTR